MEPFSGVPAAGNRPLLAQILGVFGSRLLPLDIHAKEKYELVVCLAGLQSYSRADINMFQFRTRHP
jgi:hypothetical protein